MTKEAPLLPLMASQVLPAYGLKEEGLGIEPFGSGLINHTWKVTTPGQAYILQRVNEAVFHQPEDIAHNVRLIADHLQQHHPDYLFVAPVVAENGCDLIYVEGKGYFRLFPFVEGSHSINVVQTPGQAYEAARQFGRFTRLLSGLDAGQLKTTIPSFHDLALRYLQFQLAVDKRDSTRLEESAELITFLTRHSGIVNEYEQIKQSPRFRLRVTHHDTKISNVLLDQQGRGLCVIDLDTVMPGYFISDVGDMMRTYLSPVSEEERDFDKIIIRDDYYKAIVEGYCREMQDELTSVERQHFFYAGRFMIYMQALRFLTDHLNGDVYYGARYTGHNFIRAANQVTLLQRLMEKEAELGQ
jgi:Ser/Thr protein kinase RdoA (MazF antagonist)